jgi:CubicO group peptidase (beta-lactamase class C family)
MPRERLREESEMTLAEKLEKLPELLNERAERYRVPGASLAVLADGETFECATGVVSKDTGVEATPDAVFQIGSITKIWTTTLIMQLVDEGRVELDAPVRTYLPEFQLGDSEAASKITVQQLLTHSSGMDGDFFEDTGRGDDCVERFVLACRALPQLHPPAEGFSYCNAGFVVAGRIIEKLRGMSWDRALKEHLAKPIGAATLESLPEQMAYYRSAVGHVPDGKGGFRVAPVPFLQRSNGPAGATPYGAARDLLQLAKLHLSGGVAEDGTRVLSEVSVRAMQEPQLDVPPGMGADRWGLGWMLFDWDNQCVIGHDGGTIGQSSFLRIVPERGIAVALLTNGGNTAALYRRVYDSVLGTLAGIALPLLAEATELEIDPARYSGSFEKLSQRIEIESRDGGLWLKMIDRRPLNPDAPQMPDVELHPVNEQLFTYTAPESRFRNFIHFGDSDENGHARWVFMGRRFPRVGSP